MIVVPSCNSKELDSIIKDEFLINTFPIGFRLVMFFPILRLLV